MARHANNNEHSAFTTLINQGGKKGNNKVDNAHREQREWQPLWTWLWLERKKLGAQIIDIDNGWECCWTTHQITTRVQITQLRNAGDDVKSL